MVYLLLSILGLITIVSIRSKWSQKKQIIFIFSTLVLGSVLYWTINLALKQVGIVEKGDPKVDSKTYWSEIGLYFSMIAGMAAKYLYDAINTGSGKSLIFNKWHFLKPILVSPIVFGAVYATAGINTSIVLLLILGFQNGFFWQTVLNKPDPVA